MTKLKKLLMLAGVYMAVSACAVSARTLTFSDYGPNRGVRAQAIEWFAQQVEKRSGGDLKIQFYWGGSLLKGKATLKGIGDGVADMGTVVSFFTPRELLTYNVIGDYPGNGDIWVGLRTMYDFATENKSVKKDLAASNVRYVANYTTGPIQLICNKKVSNLDELKAAKVRASGLYGDTLRSLGVNVFDMSQADVYQALDSGLIDCNQNFYYAINSYSQYEVAHYIIELNWGQITGFAVLINDRTYQSLSDSQRKVLDSVAKDFQDHLAERMIEDDKTIKAKMIKGINGNKVDIYPFPKADHQEIIDASLKVFGKSIGTLDANTAQATVDSFKALLKKYENEKDKSGYPWTR